MKEHVMSVGDHIKSASENASHLTQRVVDAVEKKVNDVTGAIENAASATGKKVRDIAGDNADAPIREEEAAGHGDRDASEHWADDGGNESRPKGATDREKRWTKATGEHWHPYEATPETQARADGETRDRSQEPNQVPSRSPDERG